MRKVSVLIAMCFVLAVALTLTGQNQQNALKNIMTQVDPAWTSLVPTCRSQPNAGPATDEAGGHTDPEEPPEALQPPLPQQVRANHPDKRATNEPAYAIPRMPQ